MIQEQCGNGGTDTAKGRAKATRTLSRLGISRAIADDLSPSVLEKELKKKGASADVIEIELARKKEQKPLSVSTQATPPAPSLPSQPRQPITVPEELKTGVRSEAARFYQVDVKEVSSDVPKTRFSADEIEEKAVRILESGGLLRPVVLEQTGIQSYKVIDGHLEYYAAARARELNPRQGEMVNAFVTTKGNSEVVLKQAQSLRG